MNDIPAWQMWPQANQQPVADQSTNTEIQPQPLIGQPQQPDPKTGQRLQSAANYLGMNKLGDTIGSADKMMSGEGGKDLIGSLISFLI